MANKLSDLLIGGDLVGQQLSEFLDPAIKMQNDIARRTAVTLQGMNPENPGSALSATAARLSAKGFENLRQGLAQNNPERFATDAELFQQQVQGLDLANPAGRAAAVAAARRINPARAMQLAQAFQAQDVASQNAIGNRYGVQSEVLGDGSIFNQTATGQQTLITKDGILTDPTEIAAKIREIGLQTTREEAENEIKTARLVQEQEAVLNQLSEAREKQDQVYNRITKYDNMLDKIINEDAKPSGLADLFPSIFRSDATNEFYALANTLGLDVIAGTTFGALSESELRFALQTAIPTLSGPDAYRRYFESKKAVEQKLLNELQDYEQFLRTEGIPTSFAGFMSDRERQDEFSRRRASLATGTVNPDYQVLEDRAYQEPEPDNGSGMSPDAAEILRRGRERARSGAAQGEVL